MHFDSFICYQDKMIQCVKQILEWGEFEYWHSKSIRKTKLKLGPHLVLKLDVLSESSFYRKRYLGHMGADLQQLPGRVFFSADFKTCFYS